MEVLLTDFKSSLEDTCCPGCGAFDVMSALGRAVLGLGLPVHQVVVVSDSGCLAETSRHVGVHGIRTLPGRVLPTATAVKVANRSLTVVATGDDVDGYCIGLGHLVHAARRNVDVTYIVMDHHVDSFTSRRTRLGAATDGEAGTHSRGSFEAPLHPLALAIVSGATFVAQGLSGDVEGLSSILAEAIRHPGFALVNVFSPCGVSGNMNADTGCRKPFACAEGQPDDDLGDPVAALSRIKTTGGLVTGILYRGRRSTFESRFCGLGDRCLVTAPSGLSADELEDLLREFE